MARTEQVTDGLVVKQKEQGSAVVIADKSITANQLADDVTFGLIPIGAVMPIMTHLTGAFTPGVSGVVVNGLMLCDGATVPVGNTLIGSVPDLSNDAYLRGSLASGVAAGANSKSLNTPQLPIHDHSGTLAADTAPHSHPGSSSAAADAPHSHTANAPTANAPHAHPSGAPNGHVFAPAGAPHSHTVRVRAHQSGGPGGLGNTAWTGNLGPVLTLSDSSNPSNTPHNQPHNTPTGAVPAYNAPHTHTVPITTNNAPHSHTITIATGSAPHTHPGSTIGTTGAGDTINFEPKYITCVYMIRVR